MNSYLKKFFPYVIPYKKYAFLNIFFNTLYALFSALSFVALIPMLDVLFKDDQKVYSRPEFSGNIGDIGSYAKELLNYKVTEIAGSDQVTALTMVIGLVILLFLLK